MNQKVLIVDDEPTITDTLRDVLSRESYGVFCSASAEKGLEILAREEIDVVISDEKMPGMLGSEFLSIVRQRYPDTIRMILTGYASLEAAIRAINEWEIYRFFTKPCNVIDLATAVRQALQQKDLRRETQPVLKEENQEESLIEDLEKQHPGITQIERDEKGSVIIDDVDTQKWETFVKKISSTG